MPRIVSKAEPPALAQQQFEDHSSEVAAHL